MGALAATFAVGVALLGPTGQAQAGAFIVDSTADAVDAHPGDGVCDDGTGSCTLRAAIMEANSLAGLDTIALPAGLYLFAIAGNEGAAAAGDLDVTSGITIVGAIVVVAAGYTGAARWLGVAALAMATINVVGGYVVTQRMLNMFTSRKKRRKGGRS